MKPISLLIERLGRIVQNDAHAHGLKPTQWEALRYLARANRFSRTPSALTRYLGMTKGTVSQTLSALEKKGLIVKLRDPSDKRAVQLSLSQSGSALLQRDPLLRLDGGEHAGHEDVLAPLLENVLRSMVAERGGRPFGMCKNCAHFQTDAAHGAPFFCGLLAEPLSADDSQAICVEQTYA